jgi:glyoxylase-like metal-dependent hydrolase (beta-lactamase superfamily II)
VCSEGLWRSNLCPPRDGEWVLVDSCINTETGNPAGLEYLSAIGVAADSAVRLVVVIHWDDDHIRGISRVVEQCSSARVACFAAIAKRQILQFVLEQEFEPGVAGSGLDELRSIPWLCSARPTGILWPKANLPLHPFPPGDAPKVVALSPSETMRDFGAIL